MRVRPLFCLVFLIVVVGFAMAIFAAADETGGQRQRVERRSVGSLGVDTDRAREQLSGVKAGSENSKALSLIFADGFESGDTSAWGAQPPAHCGIPDVRLP